MKTDKKKRSKGLPFGLRGKFYSLTFRIVSYMFVLMLITLTIALTLMGIFMGLSSDENRIISPVLLVIILVIVSALVGCLLSAALYGGRIALAELADLLGPGGLERLGLKHNRPQGTYFVLLDISDFLALDQFKGWSDMEFCEWMIREIGVAAVPGSSFFREPVNHLIRLHFARSEETLQEALDRLAKLAALLK